MPSPLLAERIRWMSGIAPIAGGSARSGDWASLKGYDGILILVHIAMGNAATTAITVDKATAVAGTGNSDGITLNHVWKRTGALGGAPTWVAQTAAASFTSSATGSGEDQYMIDIPASELGEGFDCVQLELGASSASNIVSAEYVLYGARYAGSVATGFVIDPTVD